MTYSYQSEQWLPYPVEPVFAFFADPENLPALMPRWQKARIEHTSLLPPPHSTSSTPMAGSGSLITLSLKPFPGAPFRVRWQAEIASFILNSQFIDRQVRGPFASWVHMHSVRGIDHGGTGVTVVLDRIEYTMPFGSLGRLAHKLFVRGQIESTFAFRHRQLAQIFAKMNVATSQPKQPDIRPMAS